MCGLFRDVGEKVGKFERAVRDAADEESGWVCADCGNAVYVDREDCPECGGTVRPREGPGEESGSREDRVGDESATAAAGDATPDAEGAPDDDAEATDESG